MIYLDYNSTAPYSQRVRAYLRENMENDWANASSEHDLGHKLAGKVKQDRQIIANFVDCTTGKIFFTSGATESINSILSIDNLKAIGVNSVITSPLEHHATLDCCKHLEQNQTKVKMIKNDQFGNFNLEDLEEICCENNNSLISLLYVNNETGVIGNIKEIVNIAKKHNCLVHIDGVQALGKLKFSLEELNVDFASFSGHKIGSLKGIGLLYIADPNKFAPLMFGGGQERKFRPGTYNFSAIHSFRLALEDVNFLDLNRIQKNKENFEKQFLKIRNDLEINGIDAPRVCNTSNIFLGGMESREAMLNLSGKEICVSTGSACSSGSIQPSHVISNMRNNSDYAKSCLRISFGRENTDLDVEIIISELNKILLCKKD